MNSRHFWVLFLLCCGLPVIAAKLYLTSGWDEHNKTVNKGQWLDREIHLLKTDAEENHHWHLVYVTTQDECTNQCEQALYAMQQLYTGFGHKQINIKPWVISSTKFPQLGRFPSLSWQQQSTPIAELQNTIVIVNQQGLVLLRYTLGHDLTQMVSTARDIRTDLLRLMNYDRGGV